MAIGIYFSPAAMSAAKYDECIKLLKKAGAGNPAGRSYHAAFGPKDKLMVFDVWTSQAAFDKFGKTLMPILQQLGIDPGQPSRDAGAQGDRAGGEGHVTQEAGESLCSPPEALTTTGPSRSKGVQRPRLGRWVYSSTVRAVGSVTGAGSYRAADCSRLTPPYPGPGWSAIRHIVRVTLPRSRLAKSRTKPV